MPYYGRLRQRRAPEDMRTIEGLLRLKDALAEQVPKRTIGEDLLLATWNIREFESTKYGPRSLEPIYYIAEIISRFDLVAVQEVRDDLSSFNTLMGLLGDDWRYLLSDVTEGQSGNSERMAFLYDSRKVEFTGLAGEMVLPSAKQKQVARTPYLVEFKAGWLRFLLCTVHMYYGDDKPNEPRRVQEIRDVAEFIAKRAASQYPDSPNTILLGDFNIFATTDATMEGIVDAGFTIPDQVLGLSTDLAGKYHYDQIALLGNDFGDAASTSAGTFKPFDYVYRLDEEKTYAASMGGNYATNPETHDKRTDKGKTTYYRGWRTHQVSDHQPMWVQLPIDASAAYLARIAPDKAAMKKRATEKKAAAKKKATAKKQAVPRKAAARTRAAMATADAGPRMPMASRFDADEPDRPLL